MSFVGPTAYGLELLMLWTDKSLHATFGIASVLGVLLGSAVVALAVLGIVFGSVAMLKYTIWQAERED